MQASGGPDLAAGHVVLLAGYASLLVELTVFAVPSVVSTRQLLARRGDGGRSWRLVLPVILAVAGFAWPGIVCLWSISGSGMSAPRGALAWSGGVLVVLGRALTWWAVAVLRRGAGSAFVEHGPYAWTRNPALLGLHGFLLGGVLLLPAWHTAAAWLVFALHMHARVLAEERHLLESGGQAYAGYLARVPRYVPAGRRRVPP
jgi:protein-S-isoprenylcysteine O-methyltransferase Ste14